MSHSTDLPAIHIGDLTITSDNLALYQALAKVSGDVYIRAAGASLPALATVSGDVSINTENASLPALTSVGGDVSILVPNASLPALTSVSDYVSINAPNASLPALTSVRGHSFKQPSAETARARLVEVAKHALAEPDALEMNNWHTCNTTHCIAGWAVHLAGQEGYDLERKIGTSNAGLVLLGVEAASMFFLSNEAATERLTKVLEDNEAASEQGIV